MMPWWFPYITALSITLIPAVLFDIMLGREKWSWALGYPVDRSAATVLWSKVRILRWLNSAIATASLFLTLYTEARISVFISILLWGLFFVFWLFFAREHLPQAKHPKRFVADVSTPKALEILQPRWEAMTWFLTLSPMISTALLLPFLPHSIGMHWNVEGIVDRSGNAAELYWLSGLGIPLQFLFLGIMAVVNQGAKPRLPIEQADALRVLINEEKQLMLLMLQWTRLFVLLTVVGAWLGIVVVNALQREDLIWLFVGGALFLDPILLCIICYWAFKLINLRSQMKDLGFDAAADRSEGYIWGGAFYYDRNDVAVWVPKRIGIGYTLNMAKPGAWIVMGAIVAAIVASVCFPLLN